MTLFQEHALSAPDVCNNCYGRIRRERDHTTTTTNQPVSAEKTPYTRTERTTVEYAPAKTASDSKTVFCECGVEGAYHRIWTDPSDRCLRKRRLKTLVKRAMRSLETKGVTLTRKTFVAVALSKYYDDHDIEAALKAATKAAVQTSAAAAADSADDQLRADGGSTRDS